jgi:hypothetical protein
VPEQKPRSKATTKSAGKPDKPSGKSKVAKSSGRTTPKGSSRYTPPTPKTVVKSPLWVPVLLFSLFAVGVLVVVTNYLGLLPGEQQNWYLLLGLAQITGGFIVATFYK